MKKVILLVTMLLSSTALAEGPEYIQGVDSGKGTGCTPPTSRTDGTPLLISELCDSRIVLKKGNTYATSTVVSNNLTGSPYCQTFFDFTGMELGQYYYTATALDCDGLESIESPSYVAFLLKAPTAPPNAPTGLTLN